MIRAFLDANVFVSGILSQNGPPGRILKDWFEQRFELATSSALLAELRRVLNYSKVRRRHGWSEAELDEFLENIESLAVIVPGELRLNVITDDPSDDRYLECALESGASYLVSGDHHLLELGYFREVEILSPRAFLKLLSERGGTGLR